TNFTRAHQPRARLVLIGNLRLEDTFAEPQLESFNQRLAARCYLQTMNRNQTREYVFHQLTAAGFKPKELITEDAIHSVYAASEGVPRLVNQIMDHSLALAANGSQCPVSSSLVQEAWAELQQLPAPWHAGADKPSGVASLSPSAASTVEFGALDDDDDWGTSSEMVVEDSALDLRSKEKVDPQTISLHVGPTKPVESRSHTFATTGSSNSDRTEANSHDELRLADEPPQQNVPPRAGNFFSAFVSPEEIAQETSDEDCAGAFRDDSTELDLASEVFNFADKPGSSAIQSKLSMSDEQPWRLPGEVTHNYSSADSFFRNRPTDEKLLAFEDEQHGYDAMGVWENDPPLDKRSADKLSFEKAIEHHTQEPSQLFGDDFDEEMSVSPAAHLTTEFPRVVPRSNPAATAAQISATGSPYAREHAAEAEHAARQAAEAADYIGRIQQFADSIAAANRLIPGPAIPCVDEILAESEAALKDKNSTQRTGSNSLDTWLVDINALDVRQEEAVQVEIEDIVSQLNFAAFSMESFSVEQIPLEPSDQRPQPPSDSIRSGKNDEIYTMHRPSEFTISERNRADFFQQSSDDDRDLLVIEEELPLANSAPDESQRPITKIAPYGQLFAKLRK
ncbi:MAG: hypothetical protein ABI557_13265, partial [Aureliella sp.]